MPVHTPVTCSGRDVRCASEPATRSHPLFAPLPAPLASPPVALNIRMLVAAHEYDYFCPLAVSLNYSFTSRTPAKPVVCVSVCVSFFCGCCCCVNLILEIPSDISGIFGHTHTHEKRLANISQTENIKVAFYALGCWVAFFFGCCVAAAVECVATMTAACTGIRSRTHIIQNNNNLKQQQKTLRALTQNNQTIPNSRSE